MEKRKMAKQKLQGGKRTRTSRVHIFQGRIPFMGYTASRARRLDGGDAKHDVARHYMNP